MNNKDSALKKADEINRQYQSSPIIKGLVDGGLSLIPFGGTAIVSGLSARAFKISEENSRRFANALNEEINGIREEKLDKAFLESDEFAVLLIETLTLNARVYEHEKTRYFARIFANATTIRYSGVHFKEGFLRIIDELSVEHIHALSFVYEKIHAFTMDELMLGIARVSSEEVSVDLGIPESRALAYCDHMIRFGLLRDALIGKYDYQIGFFQMTEYGNEFAEFLKQQE